MDRRFPKQAFNLNDFSGFFESDKSPPLKVEFLTGGACNSNYLVSTSEDEKVVCRVHSRKTAKMESYINSLVKGVVPTSELLWTSGNFSVRHYIEGEAFTPSPSVVKEAGLIIAKMSKVKFEGKGYIQTDGTVTPIEGWNSIEKGLFSLLEHKQVKEILPNALSTHLKRIVNDYSHIFSSFDESRNLVHGDFRPDNILVSNHSIKAVIDWEFAHSGCSYMDIGNIMRHLPGKWAKDLESGLIEGGFNLHENWLFRAKLIDLISHLEFLTSGRSQKFKESCLDKIKDLVVFEQNSNIT